MKSALMLTMLWISLLVARAGDLEAALKVLGDAKIGDDYAMIKKLLPSLGPLKPDTGAGNTEATVELKAGELTLKGEFNFAEGRLVSHGFTSGEINHAEAHALLLKAVAILEKTHGKSERGVELPNETDGPRDALGIHFSWKRDKTLLALNLGYRSKTAAVSWGAQDVP